jgi:hypothetical protein
MNAGANGVRELDRNLGETRCLQSGAVLGDAERTGDAADVAAPLGSLGLGEPVLGDQVADADPAVGARQSRLSGAPRNYMRAT